MGRTALVSIFLICTVGLSCATLSAPPPVMALPAPAPTIPDPTLDQAEALLNAQQYKAAKQLLVDWLKANPHAPDRDRGIFIMARYYTDRSKLIHAFYQYDELVDNLPDSPFYYRSLENQYRIADLLLGGYKTKFLGLRIVSNEDVAIEMLYRIQERVPGSPLAERAMWRTADYYYRSSQFELAADVYAAYIRSYPRSPLIPRAMLRRAFSSLAQFRGVPFDATPLIDARTQFQDIIARYPNLAAEENLNDIIDLIDRTMAQKMLSVAKFYSWTGKPVAAAYTYRSLIDIYPNSREADTARTDLSHMPGWVLAQPAPPATQPSDAFTPSLNVPGS
jgi:outer membrane protein assembly factor BamD (BamD/ComL family)